jgi:adenylosuccinate lyase
MQVFISQLDMPDEAKAALLALTPRGYTGYAQQLAQGL